MIDTKYHANLQIPKNGEYVNGKRDLFAAVIALKLLLPSREFKQMIVEIDEAINKITPELHVLNIDEILLEMGFPANWKKIKSMQK